MTFGLTIDGFQRKRLADIVAQLEADIASAFDVPLEEVQEPSSVWAQLIGVFARPTAEVWELAEAVYFAQYPDSANGIGLDNVAALFGLTRQAATFSSVTATLIGDTGTLVPAGSVASVSATGARFISQTAETIQAGPQRSVVSILQASDNSTYRVTVNVTDYEYTAAPADSVADIVAALVALIDAGPDPIDANDLGGGDFEVVATSGTFTISVSADIPRRDLVRVLQTVASFTYQVTIDGQVHNFTSDSDPTINEITAGLVNAINTGPLSPTIEAIDNVDGTFTVRSTVPGDTYTITTSPQLQATETTPVEGDLIVEEAATINSVDVLMLAEDPGPIAAPAGELDTIETPVSGWDAVTNENDATLGRREETDAELRLRRAESIQIAGAAVVEAIRSRLLDFTGVTSALVVENPEDAPDPDGRPGHSFEAIVEGGDEQGIADLLWDIKPAGIQTTSTATGVEKIQRTVIDSQGDSHEIFFSRPTEVEIWLEVDVTRNPEEPAPVDLEAQIEEDLLAFGAALEIGEDVIVSKLFGVVHQTPGVATVEIRIGLSDPPSGSSNIPISAQQKAVFDSSRTTVTDVT